ncbi:MAG: ATP-dependent Clp protease proteolytic subunit [Leptospiraceae bacterium]|jgi:ClpP class serine protease|nr:ATP-dependent Clp protease proteolytic subunit [Leptospiraceae bacterium]
MDLINIFWFILLFMSIQPLLKQRMLESTRARLISILERKRNSRVILLVHRQEKMSFLGIPFFKYIDIEDSEEVIRAIQMTPKDMPIDIILHTPGGLVLASYQIARALKNHQGKVTAFVPHFAMSGGTLIALSADEIVMGEQAVLGPVDPQLGQYPAASLIQLKKLKPIDKIEDKNLIMIDMAEKAMQQIEKQVKEILKDNYEPEKVEHIAKILSQGTWTHDYPITYEEAREIGLNVSTDMPQEIYHLMSLYPQPLKQTPSVEYIPIPKHKDSN